MRKLEANGDLLIGRSAKSGKLLHYDGAAHLLTMAPTRSGSVTSHVSARRLATPDEIMRMHTDTLLLLRQGYNPLQVEKIRYYAEAEFAGMFDPA